jgi:hypothetical protein
MVNVRSDLEEQRVQSLCISLLFTNQRIKTLPHQLMTHFIEDQSEKIMTHMSLIRERKEKLC